MKQSGIALFSTLVFMLVSTLISVASLQSTVLSEKIASTSKRHLEVEQLTEYVLLDAELFVTNNATAIINSILSNSNSQTCQADLNGQHGLCIPIKYTATFNPTSPQAAHWRQENTWQSTNRHSVIDVNHLQSDADAKFIIEFMGYSINLGADGTHRSRCSTNPDYLTNPIYHQYPYCSQDQPLFRLTALATIDNTRSMSQTTLLNGSRKSWRQMEFD